MEVLAARFEVAVEDHAGPGVVEIDFVHDFAGDVSCHRLDGCQDGETGDQMVQRSDVDQFRDDKPCANTQQGRCGELRYGFTLNVCQVVALGET